MADRGKRPTTHGVMFHHFHNESHPTGQGSLSADDFEAMIDHLSRKYTIVSATDYARRLKSNTLRADDICFTFDDALLCQTEIAAPIMREKGIEAFFFVYSSPFQGNPDYLEIFRYFRTASFGSVDEFYDAFSDATKEQHPELYATSKARFDAPSYLSEFPFYTVPDKWFRYLRDVALGKLKYESVMRSLMAARGFNPQAIMKKLWMDDAQLRALRSEGHVIGLHTFSHPTTMDLLAKEAQAEEFRQNNVHLMDVLNERPLSMSHPCGRYNDDTLAVLREMGVEIGFRSNYAVREIRTPYEVPREDHTNVMKEMAQ
jgi:peptidoglycan/xylan/chitin deacetylase (PgdA/CDA1 family)